MKQRHCSPKLHSTRYKFRYWIIRQFTQVFCIATLPKDDTPQSLKVMAQYKANMKFLLYVRRCSCCVIGTDLRNLTLLFVRI